MVDDDMAMEKLRAPADFDGPTQDRHCTDVLCTLMLVASWVAMTALGIYSVQNGDYRVVLYPLDYDGNICGTDYGEVDMTEYPYLYVINSYTGGVCVKDCPSLSENQTVDGVTDVRTLITYDGVWQADGAELPLDYIEVGNYSGSDDAIACDEDTCFPNNSPPESWSSTGINYGYGFAYYVGDSYDWLGYCYLTVEAEERIEALVEANSTLVADGSSNKFWNDLYADLYTARKYILGFGFGVAVIISFIYTFLLRFPCLLNIVIWGSIFASIAMFGVAGYYAVDLAQQWEDADPQVQSDSRINASRIFGYVLWGIGAFIFLLIVCLRKQIQLAIGCVKGASRAITRMPIIVLLPVVQGAGFICFMIVLILYGVHLASLGEVSKTEVTIDPFTGLQIAFRTFEFDDFVSNSAWYLLFCFFWTSNFIVAVGDMIVAMSVAKWYFTRNKRSVGSCTVIRSFCDVHRYHLGTCAYGSLVIAVVQIFRAMVTRVQKKIKEMTNSNVANCLMCCCQCCLWCLEKCMKFLSKNAYIQTAIFGTSFCDSCRAAFNLIMRNAARVGAITYVSAAILIVGKLFIATITTGLGYFVISEQIRDELHSIVGPVVFVYLVAYFVSDMFMDIFDMAIDTILQCFIADEEMFGDGSACYADASLKKWIDKNGGRG